MDWREVLSNTIVSLGIDLMAMKSGLFGGFISLGFERKQTPGQAIIFIATSALFAGYMGPFVQEWFDLSDRAANGSSFLLGFLAVKVIIPRMFEAAERAMSAVTIKKNGK
jgi:hypothetical protein